MSDLGPLSAQEQTSYQCFLATDRLQQHGVPVEIEELLLAAGEYAHVDGLSRVDTHPLKRGSVRDG